MLVFLLAYYLHRFLSGCDTVSLELKSFSCIAEVCVTSAYPGILSRSSAWGVSGPGPASSATLASAVICSGVRSRVGHSEAPSQTARAGVLPQAWCTAHCSNTRVQTSHPKNLEASLMRNAHAWPIQEVYKRLSFPDWFWIQCIK